MDSTVELSVFLPKVTEYSTILIRYNATDCQKEMGGFLAFYIGMGIIWPFIRYLCLHIRVTTMLSYLLACCIPPSPLKDQANHLSVLISPPLPLACSRHIFVRKPLRLCDHASGDKCLKELYSQSMMHYNNMCSAAYTFLELLHNPSFLEVMVKVATYTSWLVLIQKYWKYLDVGQKKNGLLSNLGYSPTVSQYLVSTVAFCATVVDLKKERFTPVWHCHPERDRRAEIESESGFGVRSSDLRQMRKR